MPTNGYTANGAANVEAVMHQDADKAGVPVHSFDPDSSPAEKGASAGKARSQLNSVVDKPPVERGAFFLLSFVVEPLAVDPLTSSYSCLS